MTMVIIEMVSAYRERPMVFFIVFEIVVIKRAKRFIVLKKVLYQL